MVDKVPMTSITNCPLQVNVRDVVINCHPESLPLSFPLLQKLWKRNLHLVFSFHIHSSVAKVPKEAQAYQQQVEQESKGKDQDVVFKIIWKNSRRFCFPYSKWI